MATLRSVVEEHVNRALSVVTSRPQDSWAREFVFDCSPAATAQMLANENALLHTATITSSDTFLEADDSSAGILDMSVLFDAIFVPSFAVGHLSVGSVVSRVASKKSLSSALCHSYVSCDETSVAAAVGSSSSVHSSLSSDVSSYMYSIGRYARDETNGKTLIIKECTAFGDASPEEVQVLCLEHMSSTRRYRSLLKCDPTTFKSGRVVDSVKMCIINEESRICPICQAPPKACCACKLPFIKPSHSLDFSGAFQAVGSHVGQFRAGPDRANIIFAFPATLPGQQYPAHCYHEKASGILHSLCGALNEDHALQRKKYILTPVVSRLRVEGYGSLSGSYSTERNACLDRLTEDLRNVAIQASASRINPTRLTMIPDEYTNEIGCTDELNDFSSEQIVDSCDAGHESTALDSSVIVEDIMDLLNTPHVEVVDEDALDKENTISRVLSACQDSNEPGLVAVDAKEGLFYGFIEGSCQFQKTASDTPFTFSAENVIISKNQPVSSNASGLFEKQDVNGALEIPIAPREREDFEDMGPNERDLRLMIRREKNRAAAARSNARRRVRNDELKAGLRRAKEQLDALRARQTELILQNADMREKLRERNVSHARTN